MGNSLIERLKKDEVALGVSLMYRNPNCIESMARGWDWVWVEGQHGQHDYASILQSVQVAQLTGLASVTRVPGHVPDVIGRVLDTDTGGLMVPMVDTPEQARELVKACYFPPLGNRSYGGRRVIDLHGREYYQTANEDLLLIAQIETPEGVSNAEAIAAVDGIDVLFFGPDDMKVRLELPINTPIQESDKLMEAMEQVANAARSAGKAAGCVAPTAESLKMAVSLGYRLIAGGSDIGFLRTASPAKLEELRAALASSKEPA